MAIDRRASSRRTAASRLAFAGTAPFAVRILERLVAAKHAIDVVYTQPARKAGRGRKLTVSPVQSCAESHGMPVRTPIRLAREAEQLSAFDAVIVAAYGLLIPEVVLQAPRHGCLNVHASLLPRWRGAAPVERAIMAGDKETGVTIMQVDAGLDTGPIIAARTLPLDPHSTGPEVTDALAELGADALMATLADVDAWRPHPQDDARATYADKLTPADALIDWGRDAWAIDRQVRALTGRMTAHTPVADARLRVLVAHPVAGDSAEPPGTLVHSGNDWSVACGDGWLVLDTVQLNRGKGVPLTMAEAVNGYPSLLHNGARLASEDASTL